MEEKLTKELSVVFVHINNVHTNKYITFNLYKAGGKMQQIRAINTPIIYKSMLQDPIILPRTLESFNVGRDWYKFLGALDCVNSDILRFFGDVSIEGRLTPVTSFIHRLSNVLTNQEIISLGRKLKVYKKFNLFDAFEATFISFRNREIEKRGTGIDFFLDQEIEGVPCKLILHRTYDGMSKIDISKVVPDCKVPAGYGVLFQQ